MASASGAFVGVHDMGICIFVPAPIGGYLAAADGSQATQSGSAHVRMAVPRCLVLGGRWCRGWSDRGTGRPTVGLGLGWGSTKEKAALFISGFLCGKYQVLPLSQWRPEPGIDQPEGGPGLP